MFSINRDRVLLIGKILASCRKIIDELEEKDIQYVVVRKILSILDDPVDAAIIIVGTALVSYMLSVKGEKHWNLLAEHVARNAGERPELILLSFVENSPSLGRFRDARLRRARLYISRMPQLLRLKFDEYVLDLAKLRNDLARILDTRSDSKTIVFSIKMFYYLLKALGKSIEVPFEIPIPVDYRVCMVSLSSGVIEAEGNIKLSDAVRILRSKYPTLVRRVWSDIGYLSRIPPLRLDALLWIVGGMYDGDVNMLYGNIEEFLGRPMNVSERRLMLELFKYRIN